MKKEAIIQTILNSLSDNFDASQLRMISNAFYLHFRDIDITAKNIQTALTTDISPDSRAYQMFFVAKKIEGLSEKSLKYYSVILRQFFKVITRPLSTITTDDIRYYLATRQKVSLVTLTNERRVLLSFFSWLTDEEYIQKNPVLKIKNIKQPKVLKKSFSQIEVEELRDACKTLRDKAIVEVFLSTGMRCGELCFIKVTDVDFINGEITVTGKGNKQRICYLNAPAKKRLRDYYENKGFKDVDQYIFSTTSGNRISTHWMQAIIRNLGDIAGVKNVHPHRFRRTAATMALQRGMPVEQVQIMLGHEKIDTTMRYAITADDTVKHSHAKYM